MLHSPGNGISPRAEATPSEFSDWHVTGPPAVMTCGVRVSVRDRSSDGGMTTFCWSWKTRVNVGAGSPADEQLTA